MKSPNRSIEELVPRGFSIFQDQDPESIYLSRFGRPSRNSHRQCAAKLACDASDRTRDEQSRVPGLFDYLTNEANVRRDRFESNRESRRDRWRLINFKSDARSSQGKLRRYRLRSAQNCTLSQYYISRRYYICFDLCSISRSSVRNVTRISLGMSCSSFYLNSRMFA